MSSSQEVLFLRDENGESKWFENGDEENDGKYVGEIENGKPNGTGTITFPDGPKYEGEFKDGEYDGQVTFTSPDGDKYVGEFKDDEFHGQVTYTWSDGDKYEGKFKDGENWIGTGYNKNGEIVVRFVNGKQIEQ